MYDIYTPDDEYFTPPNIPGIATTTTTTQLTQTMFSQNEYQSFTIKSIQDDYCFVSIRASLHKSFKKNKIL